jgi:tellurite resistance protein TerC
MTDQLWLWVVFNIFVLSMLALDLGVFHRHAHQVHLREALTWSAVWIVLALIFNAGVYFWLGDEPALAFLTGYLIEKSLSIDNIFVFLLIFTYFQIPSIYQHKVLFWGIVGALIMRAIMIVAGAALIKAFHPIIYVFGVFLIITGIRLSFNHEKEVHPERNPILRLFHRLMPAVREYHNGHFFVRHAGRLAVTPLFVTLIMVETTDLIFALDSIPAIFAITTDSFIVYTSNVFAILGLRALFFAVAGLVRIFHHLHHGLAVVLVFVGVKMVLSDIYKIPTPLSLAVVAVVLLGSILASLLLPQRDVGAARHASEPASPTPQQTHSPSAGR